MRRMRGTGWLALLLLLAAGPGWAQGRRHADEEGRGFFMIGAHQLDLEALNDRLDAFDYPPLREGVLSLGGGGWGSRGRWLIGGEGHALVGRKRTTADDSHDLRLTGGYGLFDVGYLVYDESGVDIYPMFGIGAGASSLSITERGSSSFNGVLGDPGRSTRLTAGMLALSFSLGLDAMVGGARPNRRGGRGGLAIGARIGYVATAANDSWKREDEYDVSGGPDAPLSGPFVMLMIGGKGTR